MDGREGGILFSNTWNTKPQDVTVQIKLAEEWHHISSPGSLRQVPTPDSTGTEDPGAG